MINNERDKKKVTFSSYPILAFTAYVMYVHISKYYNNKILHNLCASFNICKNNNDFRN